ncbi:MAG TPA: ATP-binding protein, partial [Vampirovibrionales bacterium]
VELQEMFALKLREKGLKLEILVENRVPTTIESDRLKLHQILTHLLSNAIKFTLYGGIKLRVNAIVDLEKTWLTFEVTDTGIGINAEDLSKLFQPFVQTETDLINSEGTGLGLVICRKYVRLLGGEITVSSVPNRGTTFKFQIVVKPVEPPDRYPKQNRPPYRILVADDEATNREILTTLLSSEGFEVREATNGQEALEIYHSFEPHLIWMDVHMTLLDGCKAAQQIKATDQESIPPIIALTASIWEQDKDSLVSAGYDDFLIKPIQKSQVFDKILDHLGVSIIYEELVPSETHQVRWKNFQKLSTSMLCDLEYATLALDDERLDRLLPQIPPECGELQQNIRDCLENFEYQIILDAIKSAKIERFANSPFTREWMIQMTQAVHTGDLSQIQQLITKIQPQNSALADQLEYHLANLDYQKILRAIADLEEGQAFDEF